MSSPVMTRRLTARIYDPALHYISLTCSDSAPLCRYDLFPRHGMALLGGV
jgi:hypothetical protein